MKKSPKVKLLIPKEDGESKEKASCEKGKLAVMIYVHAEAAKSIKIAMETEIDIIKWEEA